MNSDFRELLQSFARHNVKYLIVGGYAVIHYSQPRYTKDLDLWIEPSAENARAVVRAFAEFGIPLIDITEKDLATEGTQFVLGVAPVMLDFLPEFLPSVLPNAGSAETQCRVVMMFICICLLMIYASRRNMQHVGKT